MDSDHIHLLLTFDFNTYYGETLSSYLILKDSVNSPTSQGCEA